MKPIPPPWRHVEATSDAKEHTLVIPGTLPGLNDYIDACRASKYGAAQMKKRVQTDIEWCILKQLKNVRITQPVILLFRWIEPNRRRDIDNIAFAKKFIIDALVEMKVLMNDGWKHVEGFADSFDVDSDNPRVEITINLGGN